MLFSYKAKLKSGETSEGTLDAVDRFALARDLRSRGYIPVSISEKGQGFFNQLSVFHGLFSKVSNTEQIVLTKNLGGMLKAGLAISRALSVLQKQTKNSKLSKILISLNNDITGGETLSSGLSKFPDVFSTLFVAMVKAGEESGNLAGALSEIGLSLEKSYSLTKKIKGALIYPSVILSAMIVIGILMFAFVVPTLAKTFKELGVVLPLSLRIIIWLGDFFSQNLILAFSLIIAVVFGIYLILRARFMAKHVDLALIKFPILSNLTKELNTARTARTMASLLASGVSIVRSTEITEDVIQNVYYKQVLRQARTSIEKGAPFSAAFEEHSELFPVMMSEMVQVGEETGKLSEMLVQVASFYEEEIENKTKNISIIIEPVLMIIIGGAVGFFAISMISPLYSIVGSIN